MSQNVLGLNTFYIIWDDWKFYKNSLRFFDIVLKYDRKPMTKQFSLLLLVLLFSEIVWTSYGLDILLAFFRLNGEYGGY